MEDFTFFGGAIGIDYGNVVIGGGIGLVIGEFKCGGLFWGDESDLFEGGSVCGFHDFKSCGGECGFD